MKFPAGCKLHLVASSENSRNAMHRIKLDLTSSDAPALIATDGRMLAVVPLQLEDGEELPAMPCRANGTPWEEITLPIEAIKAASAMKAHATKGVSIRVEGHNVVLADNRGMEQRFAMQPEDEEQAGFFPKHRAVTPSAKGRFAISLDPNLLLAIADAIRDGKSFTALTLHIDVGPKGHEHPVLLTSSFARIAEDIKPTKNDKGETDIIRTRHAYGVLMPIT